MGVGEHPLLKAYESGTRSRRESGEKQPKHSPTRTAVRHSAVEIGALDRQTREWKTETLPRAERSILQCIVLTKGVVGNLHTNQTALLRRKCYLETGPMLQSGTPLGSSTGLHGMSQLLCLQRVRHAYCFGLSLDLNLNVAGQHAQRNILLERSVGFHSFLSVPVAQSSLSRDDGIVQPRVRQAGKNIFVLLSRISTYGKG